MNKDINEYQDKLPGFDTINVLWHKDERGNYTSEPINMPFTEWAKLFGADIIELQVRELEKNQLIKNSSIPANIEQIDFIISYKNKDDDKLQKMEFKAEHIIQISALFPAINSNLIGKIGGLEILSSGGIEDSFWPTIRNFTEGRIYDFQVKLPKETIEQALKDDRLPLEFTDIRTQRNVNETLDELTQKTGIKWGHVITTDPSLNEAGRLSLPRDLYIVTLGEDYDEREMHIRIKENLPPISVENIKKGLLRKINEIIESIPELHEKSILGQNSDTEYLNIPINMIRMDHPLVSFDEVLLKDDNHFAGDKPYGPTLMISASIVDNENFRKALIVEAQKDISPLKQIFSRLARLQEPEKSNEIE